jgi:hypothetical protein
MENKLNALVVLELFAALLFLGKTGKIFFASSYTNIYKF